MMKDMRSGGFLISKIHQVSGRIFAGLLKKYKAEEINPAQGRIMFPLWKKDGISIKELARETALGKSTLTSMLDRLEREGHIKRVPSRKDRREILIHLTEKDRLLQEKYAKVSAHMNELYYRGFTEKEIGEFEGHLERILANLLAHAK